MNITEAQTRLYNDGIKALADAQLCVTDAGDKTAGPDAVDAARQKFEVHIQEARDAFGQWFAELLANHPVTPEHDKGTPS